MGKSKVNMSSDEVNKCHAIIHVATVAAGAAGAIPIPMSDVIPIGVIQMAMITSLGKAFDLTISQSAIQGIAGVGMTSYAGHTVFRSVAKLVPGFGSLVGGTTAAVFTEMLGWIIADDFFRMSNGQRPENIQNLDKAVGIYDRYDKKAMQGLPKKANPKKGK